MNKDELKVKIDKGHPIFWNFAFTDRQMKEIDFSMAYAEDYCHGTDGHNAKIIIAKMAKILNAIGRGESIEEAVLSVSENENKSS